MRSFCLATLLFTGAVCAHAGELAPSVVMRQLPSIPEEVQAGSCAAADDVLASAEQQATADMMKVQKLSTSMMSVGDRRVGDKQGKLIGRLMDPEVTLCEMNARQLQGDEVAATFDAEREEIHRQVRRDIESDCPVIGRADYRDEACVKAILLRGLEKERAALARYIQRANAVLDREAAVYARCAETRERLAAQAEAAQLPAQYRSIAMSTKANGWQQVRVLAERYRQLCKTAVGAASHLRERHVNLSME